MVHGFSKSLTLRAILSTRRASDALLKATISGRTEVVKLLLAHPNINVNVGDHSHTTPLLWALALSRNEIVNLLLTSPGIDVHAVDKEGDNALLVASKYGNLNAVKTILSFPNVDVSYVDFDNKTAREVALTYHSRSRDTKCGRRPLSRREWVRDVRSQMDGAMPPPFDRRPLRENLERILTAQLSNLGRSRL